MFGFFSLGAQELIVLGILGAGVIGVLVVVLVINKGSKDRDSND
jgi:hypothetical protein